MSHATTQMRAAIERLVRDTAEAQRVAQSIEYSGDANDYPELCGMAVSVDNLLQVILTALDRCEAEVRYAERD